MRAPDSDPRERAATVHSGPVAARSRSNARRHRPAYGAIEQMTGSTEAAPAAGVTPRRYLIWAVLLVVVIEALLLATLAFDISGRFLVLGWLLVCGSVVALGIGLKAACSDGWSTAVGSDDVELYPYAGTRAYGRSQTVWSRLGRLFAHRY